MGTEYHRLKTPKTCADCGDVTKRQSGGGKYACERCAAKRRAARKSRDRGRSQEKALAEALAARDELDAAIEVAAAKGSDPGEIGSDLYELIRRRTQLSYRRLKRLGLEDEKYEYKPTER